MTALATQAAEQGLEAADYAQTILLRQVESAISDRSVAKMLIAEADVKAGAALLARQISPPEGFDPHVTLAVFRAIRSDPAMHNTYLTAIGGGTGFERGNPQKARVNRAVGSTVKAAVRASSSDSQGRVTKVEISGEFCFSYTLLHAA